MPDINKALDVYVRLAAHACEMQPEDFRPILEGYYELRRAAEDDLQVRIFPTLSAEQLHEEIERAAVRSPAAEFIAKAAAPEEPPAETQVAQDLFEAAPPPVPEEPDAEPATPECFEAVEVRKDAASLRGTAARKFKGDTRDRLEKARKEKKLSLASIAEASGGSVGIKDLLNILECVTVDFKVYVAAAKALDALNA